MSKKSKSKEKKSTVQKDQKAPQTTSVWEKRNRELLNLQMHIRSLKKSISELESKIESQGISGYYSQNHDCRRYSESVWWSCLKLAMLKELDEEINGKNAKKDSPIE